MISTFRALIASLFIATSMFLVMVPQAFSEGMPSDQLNLTPQQIQSLSSIMKEYSEEQFEIISKINGDMMVLDLEVRRGDRFDNNFKETASVRKVNKKIRSIASLYGELFKSRVAYLLKAKDILTLDQKIQLIRSLDYEIDIPDNLAIYLEIDITDFNINLSADQRKKIVTYHADMEIKAIKEDLKIEKALIDLEGVLLEGKEDPEKVNKLIMKMADAGTEVFKARVDYFINAKDVLTVEQRKMLAHIFMLAS